MQYAIVSAGDGDIGIYDTKTAEELLVYFGQDNDVLAFVTDPATVPGDILGVGRGNGCYPFDFVIVAQQVPQ